MDIKAKESRLQSLKTQIRESSILHGLNNSVSFTVCEANMNMNVLQRVINECNQTAFHHKFIINNVNFTSKRHEILKLIIDFLDGASIIPIHFRIHENQGMFLATNCREAIMKIISKRFVVPNPEDANKFLSITIICNFILSINVDPHNPENLQENLTHRFKQETKSLALTSFCEDEGLDDYYPLYVPQVMLEVMAKVANMHPVMVNLQYNCLKDINSIYPLNKNELTSLDLRNNQISSLDDLQCLEHFVNLECLNLSGNPICNKYNSYNYVLNIKHICKSLKVLDNFNLANPPTFRKNFMCSPEAIDFANEFIEHYFTVYDSKRRSSLKDLYDEHSMFSVTSRIIPDQDNSESTNLSHFGIDGPYAVQGVDNIIEVFEEYPESHHDPYTFVCDVLFYEPTFAAISIGGLFQETKSLIAFTRTFILKRHLEEFSITNDQLVVQNAKNIQLSWAFRFPATNSYLPFFPDQYHKIVEVFQNLTKLNKATCDRYLLHHHYDLKKAIKGFCELFILDKIPKALFSDERYVPEDENSFPNMIKDAMQKVNETATSRTVWQLLNSERLKTTDHSEIVTSKTTNKIYRTPVEEVKYPAVINNTPSSKNIVFKLLAPSKASSQETNLLRPSTSTSVSSVNSMENPLMFIQNNPRSNISRQSTEFMKPSSSTLASTPLAKDMYYKIAEHVPQTNRQSPDLTKPSSSTSVSNLTPIENPLTYIQSDPRSKTSRQPIAFVKSSNSTLVSTPLTIPKDMYSKKSERLPQTNRQSSDLIKPSSSTAVSNVNATHSPPATPKDVPFKKHMSLKTGNQAKSVPEPVKPSTSTFLAASVDKSNQSTSKGASFKVPTPPSKKGSNLTDRSKNESKSRESSKGKSQSRFQNMQSIDLPPPTQIAVPISALTSSQTPSANPEKKVKNMTDSFWKSCYVINNKALEVVKKGIEDAHDGKKDATEVRRSSTGLAAISKAYNSEESNTKEAIKTQDVKETSDKEERPKISIEIKKLPKQIPGIASKPPGAQKQEAKSDVAQFSSSGVIQKPPVLLNQSNSNKNQTVQSTSSDKGQQQNTKVADKQQQNKNATPKEVGKIQPVSSKKNQQQKNLVDKKQQNKKTTQKSLLGIIPLPPQNVVQPPAPNPSQIVLDQSVMIQNQIAAMQQSMMYSAQAAAMYQSQAMTSGYMGGVYPTLGYYEQFPNTSMYQVPAIVPTPAMIPSPVIVPTPNVILDTENLERNYLPCPLAPGNKEKVDLPVPPGEEEVVLAKVKGATTDQEGNKSKGKTPNRCLVSVPTAEKLNTERKTSVDTKGTNVVVQANKSPEGSKIAPPAATPSQKTPKDVQKPGTSNISTVAKLPIGLSPIEQMIYDVIIRLVQIKYKDWTPNAGHQQLLKYFVMRIYFFVQRFETRLGQSGNRVLDNKDLHIMKTIVKEPLTNIIHCVGYGMVHVIFHEMFEYSECKLKTQDPPKLTGSIGSSCLIHICSDTIYSKRCISLLERIRVELFAKQHLFKHLRFSEEYVIKQQLLAWGIRETPPDVNKVLDYFVLQLINTMKEHKMISELIPSDILQVLKQIFIDFIYYIEDNLNKTLNIAYLNHLINRMTTKLKNCQSGQSFYNEQMLQVSRSFLHFVVHDFTATGKKTICQRFLKKSKKKSKSDDKLGLCEILHLSVDDIYERNKGYIGLFSTLMQPAKAHLKKLSTLPPSTSTTPLKDIIFIPPKPVLLQFNHRMLLKGVNLLLPYIENDDSCYKLVSEIINCNNISEEQQTEVFKSTLKLATDCAVKNIRKLIIIYREMRKKKKQTNLELSEPVDEQKFFSDKSMVPLSCLDKMLGIDSSAITDELSLSLIHVLKDLLHVIKHELLEETSLTTNKMFCTSDKTIDISNLRTALCLNCVYSRTKRKLLRNIRGAIYQAENKLKRGIIKFELKPRLAVNLEQVNLKDYKASKRPRSKIVEKPEMNMKCLTVRLTRENLELRNINDSPPTKIRKIDPESLSNKKEQCAEEKEAESQDMNTEELPIKVKMEQCKDNEEMPVIEVDEVENKDEHVKDKNDDKLENEEAVKKEEISIKVKIENFDRFQIKERISEDKTVEPIDKPKETLNEKRKNEVDSNTINTSAIDDMPCSDKETVSIEKTVTIKTELPETSTKEDTSDENKTMIVEKSVKQEIESNSEEKSVPDKERKKEIDTNSDGHREICTKHKKKMKKRKMKLEEKSKNNIEDAIDEEEEIKHKDHEKDENAYKRRKTDSPALDDTIKIVSTPPETTTSETKDSGEDSDDTIKLDFSGFFDQESEHVSDTKFGCDLSEDELVVKISIKKEPSELDFRKRMYVKLEPIVIHDVEIEPKEEPKEDDDSFNSFEVNKLKVEETNDNLMTTDNEECENINTQSEMSEEKEEIANEQTEAMEIEQSETIEKKDIDQDSNKEMKDREADDKVTESKIEQPEEKEEKTVFNNESEDIETDEIGSKMKQSEGNKDQEEIKTGLNNEELDNVNTISQSGEEKEEITNILDNEKKEDIDIVDKTEEKEEVNNSFDNEVRGEFVETSNKEFENEAEQSYIGEILEEFEKVKSAIREMRKDELTESNETPENNVQQTTDIENVEEKEKASGSLDGINTLEKDIEEMESENSILDKCDELLDVPDDSDLLNINLLSDGELSIDGLDDDDMFRITFN